MEERTGNNNGGGEGGGEVKAEVEEVVLPGFRFYPTDEELVSFYLRRKVDRRRLSFEIIKEIDIYKYDPWDLPRAGVLGEKEWYFFCLRGRKYRNSIRPNRVTRSGFWKATGIDRPIYTSPNSGECVGLKKSLVYYQGSAGKGTKTDWMMHEYRLPSSPDSIQAAEIWTLCRIIKRSASLKKRRQQLSWKEAFESLDSNSKTCSFESDCREENRNPGSCSLLHAEGGAGNCREEEKDMVQLCKSGERNADERLYASGWRSGSVRDGRVFSEGNWEEIGRTVEYIMEPGGADALVYY